MARMVPENPGQTGNRTKSVRQNAAARPLPGGLGRALGGQRGQVLGSDQDGCGSFSPRRQRCPPAALRHPGILSPSGGHGEGLGCPRERGQVSTPHTSSETQLCAGHWLRQPGPGRVPQDLFAPKPPSQGPFCPRGWGGTQQMTPGQTATGADGDGGPERKGLAPRGQLAGAPGLGGQSLSRQKPRRPGDGAVDRQGQAGGGRPCAPLRRCRQLPPSQRHLEPQSPSRGPGGHPSRELNEGF